MYPRMKHFTIGIGGVSEEYLLSYLILIQFISQYLRSFKNNADRVD